MPQIKGYIGVTVNDWFAFLSQQPGTEQVNFLPKTARHRTADKPAIERRINLEQKWVNLLLKQNWPQGSKETVSGPPE